MTNHAAIDIGANSVDLLVAGVGADGGFTVLTTDGLFGSHAAHHHHSEYIIRNGDRLTGYSGREVEVIDQVARYHRRSAPKKSHSRFVAVTKPDQHRVRWLADMLYIAIALDRTRSSMVNAVSITATDDALKIVAHVGADQDSTVDTFTANGRSPLLGRVANREVVIVSEQGEPNG